MNLLSEEKLAALMDLAEKGHTIRWITKVTGVAKQTVQSYRNFWVKEGVVPSNCPCGLVYNHHGRCGWRWRNEPNNPKAKVVVESLYPPVEQPQYCPTTNVDHTRSGNILGYTHIPIPLPPKKSFCPLPYQPVVEYVDPPNDPPKRSVPKPTMTVEDKRERHRVKQKAWRAKNRDKLNARRRMYYIKNNERLKQYQRNWHNKNKTLDAQQPAATPNNKRNVQPAPTQGQIQQATEEYLAKGNTIS